MGGGDKQMAYVPAAMGEKGKSKEQLAEEKRVALAVRVAPLVGVEELSASALQEKASEFWKRIVKLETEKYDLEMRMNRQDYDIRELKERQKQQLRQKALKKGLDPEALTGKHPPKIQTASKFERRTDRRTYDDKKKLFEGGWDDVHKEDWEKYWQEKYAEFMARTITRLPKWFGERPGRKGAGDDTPEVEEEDIELPPPPPPMKRRKKRNRRSLKRRKKKKRRRRRKKRKKNKLYLHLYRTLHSSRNWRGIKHRFQPDAAYFFKKLLPNCITI